MINKKKNQKLDQRNLHKQRLHSIKKGRRVNVGLEKLKYEESWDILIQKNFNSQLLAFINNLKSIECNSILNKKLEKRDQKFVSDPLAIFERSK